MANNDCELSASRGERQKARRSLRLGCVAMGEEDFKDTFARLGIQLMTTHCEGRWLLPLCSQWKAVRVPVQIARYHKAAYCSWRRPGLLRTNRRNPLNKGEIST